MKRFDSPGCVHELTFSCFERRLLLTDERTLINLADAVAKASLSHNCGIVAYVFMPSHVHMLVRPYETEYSIADFLKSIKQPVARKEITNLKKNSPDLLNELRPSWKDKKYYFWLRGGGYDRNITSMEALKNSIEYIHNNPVRKELVANALDWKWSSARDWILNENGVIPIAREML